MKRALRTRGTTGRSRPRATKDVIRTASAPPPNESAPYSQGIDFRDLVFVSGQIPVDPVTGELVQGGIVQQTERVMENVKAVLEAAGTQLENVLKATVFLTDRRNFAEMNAVYRRYVGPSNPARGACQ